MRITTTDMYNDAVRLHNELILEYKQLRNAPTGGQWKDMVEVMLQKLEHQIKQWEQQL